MCVNITNATTCGRVHGDAMRNA